MLRTLNGNIVGQRTDNGFFSANDLLNAYLMTEEGKKNPKILAEYFRKKSTDEIIEEIRKDLNMENSTYLNNDVYNIKRGSKGGTYMHPYLFVDFAMWLSPSFRLQAIKWIYDKLIPMRHLVGDTYKDLTKAIKDNLNPADYTDYQREANMINELVFDGRAGQRNLATEKQLDLLDRLQVADIKLIEKGIVSIYDRRNKLKEFLELLSN